MDLCGDLTHDEAAGASFELTDRARARAAAAQKQHGAWRLWSVYAFTMMDLLSHNVAWALNFDCTFRAHRSSTPEVLTVTDSCRHVMCELGGCRFLHSLRQDLLVNWCVFKVDISGHLKWSLSTCVPSAQVIMLLAWFTTAYVIPVYLAIHLVSWCLCFGHLGRFRKKHE